MDYEKLFSLDPFGVNAFEKHQLFEKWLSELNKHHKKNCEPYKTLCNFFGYAPALPVRLFKELDLKSIGTDDVAKTMTSSGTTGQRVSKIYLDRATSARQSKALSKIVSSFVGKERLPMLIIDSSAVLKNRKMFSARGAGILGFSMLGRDISYALDDEMNFDHDAVDDFFRRHTGEKFLAFGFTYIVWEHFCKTIMDNDISLPTQGILIHGGGWKKMAANAIGNTEFKRVLKEEIGFTNVYNYYGMVEQTGSIYMECEHGFLHPSIFSDIDVLDPLTLKHQDSGTGVLKCTSLLPTSYPGHVLLTEDMGEVFGEDVCPCGRKGKFFKVYGRMQGAEIRGCSDTYEQH